MILDNNEQQYWMLGFLGFLGFWDFQDSPTSDPWQYFPICNFSLLGFFTTSTRAKS